MRLFRRGDSRQRSKGQGLVEFALAAPLIVLLIAGVLDFGRGVFTFNTVSQASRSAARTAMVDQNVTDVQICRHRGRTNVGPDHEQRDGLLQDAGHG